jgi:hypothetical protein
MDLKSRQLVWRSSVLLRRAASERRRRLVREVSSYRTNAERAELLAAIERCSSPGREEIRRLLVPATVSDPASTGPWHLRT